MKKVIIIGAGGHAKVIADIIRKNGDFIAGFLDDGKPVGSEFCGGEILGKTTDAVNFDDCEFIIAIGSNQVRKALAVQELKYYTAVHPEAVVADDVTVGEGTAVMAGAVINPGAEIGAHVIVNTRAVVEHDCKIESFVHISPGAVVCGTVKIGKTAWIGAGAVVKNNVSVCAEAMVGAGAAVVCDITEKGVYAGVPARKIK